MQSRAITPEQAFGRVVRELRLAKDLSQEDLALASDRHRTYISLLERGRNSPSLKTILRLAEVLEIDPSDLIERVERMRRQRAR